MRGRKIDNCKRLLVNGLESLGMVMNAYEMMVIREDGPEKKGECVMVKGDDMSAVF